MKKIIILTGLMLAGITGVNADYKVFDNQLDFENSMGAVCEAATDGCNNYFMQDGKVAGGTLMFCADKKAEWTCTKFKGDVMTTRMIETTKFIEGIVTKVEDGKDGVQATIKTEDNKEYTTSISVKGDEFIKGGIDDVKIGAKIKAYYTENTGNMLFGDKIEFIKKQVLSENDYNQYITIKNNSDKKFTEEHNKIISTYVEKIKKINTDKNNLNKKVINTLDKHIMNFLLKFPQDKALSKEDNAIYTKLVFLKLELMQLDFSK